MASSWRCRCCSRSVCCCSNAWPGTAADGAEAAAAAGAALTPKQREALGAWRKAFARAYEREDAQREREAQREAAQREVARLARLRRFEAAEGGGSGPEDVD